MPQLDIDLYDNFLFFAFISLIFGFGDDDVDENIIEVNADSYLWTYFQKNTTEIGYEIRYFNAKMTELLN